MGRRSESEAPHWRPRELPFYPADDTRLHWAIFARCMVSKGLTRGWESMNQAFQPVIPGRAKREPGIHRAASVVGAWIPGSRQEARPEMTLAECRRPYFALCTFVTVYPAAASSASNVTLSPTFTCLSTSGSLTRSTMV